MITIKKNSWHYRLMYWCGEKLGSPGWDSDMPKSLCTYFWTFWGKLLFFSFIFFIVVPFLIYCLGIAPIMYFAAWIMYGLLEINVLFGIGIFAWCFIAAAFLYCFGCDVKDRLTHRYAVARADIECGDQDKHEKSFVELVLYYFISVKNRICPRVEYK